MKQRWMVYTKKADFKKIAARCGIDQVTARIIINRGVKEDEAEDYLNGSLEDLSSPYLMKDMKKAADIIGSKVRDGLRIRVIGDYDIDGVCSTYILVSALKRIGGEVDYDIPDRVKDGYGINSRMAEAAARDGIDTILTCDNGISAADVAAYANSLGLTVIITDHHEIPFAEEDGKRREVIPPADAVINPHQGSCPYPFKELCGAAIALRLAETLYEDFSVPACELSPFVEAAGFATVGDVVPLTGENRILVKEGLKRMKNSRIVGLGALICACGLDPETLGSYHIGFVAGPCLNAGGRLSTAKRSLALFLEEDEAKAADIARDLKSLNDRRKDMTAQGVEAAVRYIEGGREDDDVYVIFLPDCHESLAGIVAGKIREQYNHPVFVITRSGENLKGSGRSIPKYSMYEKLCECREYLLNFGGHPMAAGLSLKEEDLEPFTAALNENSGLSEDDFVKEIWIDAAMPFSYVTEKLVDEFRVLEPCGSGNEKPLFAQKGLRVREKRLVGKNRNVLKLLLADEAGRNIDAVMFTDAQAADEKISEGAVISVAYYPEVHEYMGKRNLQMVIQSYMAE